MLIDGCELPHLPRIDKDHVALRYVLGDGVAVHDGDAKDVVLPSAAQVAGPQGASLARLYDRRYTMTVTSLPHLSEKSADQQIPVKGVVVCANRNPPGANNWR